MPHHPALAPRVPQVGALLVLNSRLPRPGSGLGDRDWILGGSCVLVSPDQVLTVEHVIPQENRKSAVFLPGVGIVELDVARASGGRWTPGDDLVVIPMRTSVTLPPLPIRKIPRVRKSGWAYVGGYGLWEGLVDGGEPPLQQVVRVSTARYPGAPPCDNLDIEWYPQLNQGIRALHYNSGGPMMWGDGRGQYWVVGINREAPPERQVASWIGWQRYHWLRSILKAPGSAASAGRPVDVDVTVPPSGEVIQVPVPEAAKRAVVTLNATGDLPLQIELEDPYSGKGAALLAKAAATPDHAGSFLARSKDLGGKGTLAVAVAPLAGLPFPPQGVKAQLRVAFHP